MRGPPIYRQKSSRYIRGLLRNRDGHLCWICNKFVSENFPENHQFSATVDHIFERSRGGQDDIHNLALAHRICNQLRSARTGLDKLLIYIEYTVYNLQFLKSYNKEKSMGNFDIDKTIQEIFKPDIDYPLCYIRYSLTFEKENLSEYEVNYILKFLETSNNEYNYAFDLLVDLLYIPEHLQWKIRQIFLRRIDEPCALMAYLRICDDKSFDFDLIKVFCVDENYRSIFAAHIWHTHISENNKSHLIQWCLDITVNIKNIEHKHITSAQFVLWFHCLRILKWCNYENFHEEREKFPYTRSPWAFQQYEWLKS